MKVGDITERGNRWPMLITAVDTYGDENIWCATSERVPGPQTKDQAEREEYCIRYEQRKAEQDAAYEAMKQAMRDMIAETGTDLEYPTAIAAMVVDKICELHSAYIDKWERD